MRKATATALALALAAAALLWPACQREEATDTRQTQGPAGNTVETEPANPIVTLNMLDSAALNAGIPQEEQACAERHGGPQMLMKGRAGREAEVEQVIRCLSDETLLRMFVSTMAFQEGSLDRETSNCIRTALDRVEIRRIIDSQNPNGPGARQAADTAVMGMIATVSCMTEEEWNRSPMKKKVQESTKSTMACAMDAMGGADGLSETISKIGQEGAAAEMAQATATCKVEGERRRREKNRSLNL